MPVIELLQRLGLVERPRQFSDADRRGIRAMIEAGISDQSIRQTFGYTTAEIRSAWASDVLTGKVRDAVLS